MSAPQGMTAGELRLALDGVPDDAPVVLNGFGLDFHHLSEVKGPLSDFRSVALMPGDYCEPECERCYIPQTGRVS